MEPDNLQEVAQHWMFYTKFGDISMENEVKFILELLVSESFSQITPSGPFWGATNEF